MVERRSLVDDAFQRYAVTCQSLFLCPSLALGPSHAPFLSLFHALSHDCWMRCGVSAVPPGLDYDLFFFFFTKLKAICSLNYKRITKTVIRSF